MVSRIYDTKELAARVFVNTWKQYLLVRNGLFKDYCGKIGVV